MIINTTLLMQKVRTIVLAHLAILISMVLQESFHIHDDQISAKKGENKKQQFIYIYYL